MYVYARPRATIYLFSSTVVKEFQRSPVMKDKDQA